MPEVAAKSDCHSQWLTLTMCERSNLLCWHKRVFAMLLFFFNSIINPRILLLLHCLKCNVLHCVSASSSHVLRAVLEPLSDLPPPAQTLMMVIDSLDVEYGPREGVRKSGSIAELLACSQHLLPSWLLLICSVRRHNKALCKMFSSMYILLL